MCGLVGMAGDIQKAERDMFSQMLIVDAIRGHHSTGVASVTASKRLEVFKKAMNPVDFMQHKQYEKVVGWDAQVLIGHNRYATVGQINNRTAHPFEFDGIVGAHNGTLLGWRNDLRDADLFDVDSECLIHNINVVGWDETIRRMHGAAALSVYHEDTHSICLFRNTERPLYFTYNEDSTVLFWASEAWMIRNLAARCGIKLQKNIPSLKENTLVSWNLPRSKTMALSDPHVRKLEVPPQKKPQPPVAQPYRGRIPAQQPANQGGNQSSTNGTGGRTGGSSFSIDPNDPAWKSIVPGRRIDFVPCSKETSPATGVPYLSGVMSDDPWIEVRYYTSGDTVDEMLDSECEYSALVASKVSAANGTDDFVIVSTQGMLKGAPYRTDDTDVDDADYEVIGIKGPSGKVIGKKEFEELAKHGCGECCCDIEFGEDVEWFAGSPICSDCMSVNK